MFDGNAALDLRQYSPPPSFPVPRKLKIAPGVDQQCETAFRQQVTRSHYLHPYRNQINGYGHYHGVPVYLTAFANWLGGLTMRRRTLTISFARDVAAQRFGRSERTITRWLRELEELDLIKRLNQPLDRQVEIEVIPFESWGKTQPETEALEVAFQAASIVVYERSKVAANSTDFPKKENLELTGEMPINALCEAEPTPALWTKLTPPFLEKPKASENTDFQLVSSPTPTPAPPLTNPNPYINTRGLLNKTPEALSNPNTETRQTQKAVLNDVLEQANRYVLQLPYQFACMILACFGFGADSNGQASTEKDRRALKDAAFQRWHKKHKTTYFDKPEAFYNKLDLLRHGLFPPEDTDPIYNLGGWLMAELLGLRVVRSSQQVVNTIVEASRQPDTRNLSAQQDEMRRHQSDKSRSPSAPLSVSELTAKLLAAEHERHALEHAQQERQKIEAQRRQEWQRLGEEAKINGQAEVVAMYVKAQENPDVSKILSIVQRARRQ